MPCSQVIGIVTLRRIARCSAKVAKITGCTSGMVLVVAWYWAGSILMATPGWSIAVGKLGRSTIRVDIVAQSDNSAGDAIEKFCSRLVIIATAVGDVACPHENRVAPLS